MNKIKSFKVGALVFFAFSVVLSIAVPVVTAFPSATIYSCNAGGDLTTEFGPGQVVYAYGEGYNPGESVTLYVAPNNGPYHKDYALCSVDAEADASGRLNDGNPIPVCTAGVDLPVGEYDMWVDRDGSGWMSYAFEPCWYWCAREGFLVIPEYWLGTILGLIGCFAAFGVFRVSKNRYI